jgi:hypothetical protein
MSPSAADPSELIPPTFAFPSPTLQDDIFTIIFFQKNRLTMVEDIEEGIIVNGFDACASSTGAAMGYKRMPTNIVEEHGKAYLERTIPTYRRNAAAEKQRDTRGDKLDNISMRIRLKGGEVEIPKDGRTWCWTCALSLVESTKQAPQQWPQCYGGRMLNL